MARIFNTADLTPDTRLTPDDQYWIYNGLDCCVTVDVLEQLLPMVDPVAQRTYDFSRNLQAPIFEMSMRGVLVDQVRRRSVTKEFEERLAQLEHQLDRILVEGIGTGINWRSPVQLNKLLYDVMGLPVQRKRNSNGILAPTTDRAALEKLQQYFIAEPVVMHMLAMRDLGKKIGFLKTGIDPDGRMRTNFNIAGTNTGRLSSSFSDFGTGTNMQNIDKTLKEIFVADEGWKFANLDLEQADSRNIGALCWNTFVESHGEAFAGAYLDACEGGDLHTTVCMMCNPQIEWTNDPKQNRAIADVLFYRNETRRDVSKKLGHGSNYLGTPRTMAAQTKLPYSLVSKFQPTYFKAFPAIPEYHRHVEKVIKESACLTSLFGRRRFFFGRSSEAATLREAVAFTGQSPTADAIDTGILNLWRSGRVRLLLQVHDAVLFMYREEEEDEVVPWAIEALKAPIRLAKGREYVIPTGAEVGWNYGYASEKNPDGMKKWKGKDERTRTNTDWKLSIGDL